MRRLFTVLLAVALAVALAGCAGSTPGGTIEMTDSRVSAGDPRTCRELGISDVRCTLLTLRAASDLEDARPDADVASQRFHAAGAAPVGQSPIPASLEAVAVVVFTLADGSRIGVPLLCPINPSGADRACDPRVQ